MTTTDRYKTEDNSAPGERRVGGHLMCMAYNCPCVASINMGGGWLCSYHADRSADRWPAITSRLLSEDAREARFSVARLRRAIHDRQVNDYPVLMRRVQNAIMAAGGTMEDVKLRQLTDWEGNQFPEPAEHFANRMAFCLVQLLSPEEPKKKSAPVRRGETSSIDALAAIVEAEAA